MSAPELQREIKEKLKLYFDDEIVIEWPISKGATDQFAPKSTRYSPRVDVAIYTAGIHPGIRYDEILGFWQEKAPEKLKDRFCKLKKNDNPRCALAIEVVFSGSSKHILGDITNASMMGLYGVVVPSPGTTAKVMRIFEYVEAIRDLGKAPPDLFRNVLVIPQDEFIDLIS